MLTNGSQNKSGKWSGTNQSGKPSIIKLYLENTKDERNNVKDEEKLHQMYAGYVYINLCYKARKGYQLVYIKKAEMDRFKSATKKIEEKYIEKAPHLKISKDRIWKKASIEATKNLDYLPTVDYAAGKEVCDNMNFIYSSFVAGEGITPTGEVIEKDF
jgi:hypothetical protein